MKTLLIYLEEVVKYLIVEKDILQFNGLMINHHKVNIDLQTEFCDWFYDENGYCKFELSEDVRIEKLG